jgi:acetylornithine/succinyldiaminopimelate/putrescine aminotransferase
MSRATSTWISSTLATEQVSLAAAGATIGVMVRERVPEHLHALGSQLHAGLTVLATQYPRVLRGVRGIPEMCYLKFTDEAAAHRVVRSAAARGVLWKANAYNFVSMAHAPEMIDRTLEVLAESLAVDSGT